MSDAVAERLSSLPKLPKRALSDLWQDMFDKPPAARSRRDFMIPILAYKIQEQAFGGLSAESRRRLRQFASSFKVHPRGDVALPMLLKPGTRLVREWKGQVHTVQVAERGFEYQGHRYASLSKVARLITGTRWSGPLFFGLKDQISSKSERKK